MAGKNLRRGKFFVTLAARVPVFMIELDMPVFDAVGSKLFWTILALEDFLFIRRMLFKPMLLKAVSPLEGQGLVFTVVMHAEEATLFLLHQEVDLGRRICLLLPLNLIWKHFAVHFFFNLVLVLVLVQAHLEAE